MNKQPIAATPSQSLMGSANKTAPQASLTFHHCACTFVRPLPTAHHTTIASRTLSPPTPHILVTLDLKSRTLESVLKPRSRQPSACTQPPENPFPAPSSKLRLRSRSALERSRTVIAVKERSKGILERKARTHALPYHRHDVRRGMAVPVGGTDQCRQPVSASVLHDYV